MKEGPTTQSEEPKLGIQRAIEADVSGILAVQDQHWLSPQVARGATEAQLKERGFLVHKLQSSDLEELLQRPDAAVIVCKRRSEVVGYAVGYTLKHQLELHPDWFDTVQFENEADRGRLENENSWYFRQIGISRSIQGQGVSTHLRQSMRQAALAQGCTSSLGEILEAPIHNDASFRTVSEKTKIIGRIPEVFENVHYVWALVETPLESPHE